MRRVLLCMLGAVEGELRLLDVLELPEVIRCMVLCMLEAEEGRLCLLEVLGEYAVCCSVCWSRGG